MKDNIKKIMWLVFATIFLLLAIYQTLKGLAMIYKPLYYIGLGVVNYYLANTAMHIYDKTNNK